MTDALPLLSADAMRAADRAAIDDWGVPGRVLMETAGREAARVIAERFEIADRHVTVLVGTGNNGGDGLVVARVLAERGATVRALILPGDGTPDRAANLAVLDRLAEDSDRIEVVRYDTIGQASNAPADLVIDTLLGIGASGPLREPAASLCAWAGRQPSPVVALDLPSGLDATTGRAASGTPTAALTVPFGAVKAGLRIGDGPRLAGEVVTAEIGIPASELRGRATAFEVPAALAGRWLPTRAADAHKYSAGRVLAVVGSRRFTGAAVLSTAAAYRAGAGAVVAVVPASARDAVDRAIPEVMVEAAPETPAGGLAADAGSILERAASADAVLVGCGLGRDPETLALVRELVARVEAPLVLDADGLAAFAGATDGLRQRSAPLVLTPHLGELRRLLGDEAFGPEDRIDAAQALARQWDATLLFKGMPSVVGRPDGVPLLGPPGLPVLATAGTGDTLAGAIAGLLAQGLTPDAAAVCGIWLGAKAAQLWATEHGVAGLIASDLVARLPAAAHALRS
ncbi:NAD(P)H-hydrate dehydratase [Rubrivirga sp. IMCC43871]|uniref:NAD(P)H-hydrate dehydratase n=1 Tax=Rubrivirga sp. IMCC43871 TaxID=3391575 RepID=UPI00398FC076